MDFKILIIAFVVIFAFLLVSSTSIALAQTGNSIQLPDWFKNNANWWNDGSISEQDIVNAIENLIEREIIIIDLSSIETTDSEPQERSKILRDVKNVFGLWGDDLADDSAIGNQIKVLIEERIIDSPKIRILIISNAPQGTLLEISINLIEKIPSEGESDKLTTDEKIALATDSSVDTDKDGIPDALELSGALGYVTDPNSPDSDKDGLSDLREYWWNTNPNDPDTNGDFISDGESVDDLELRVYPYISLDSGKDQDNDGIPTAAERFDTLTNFKLSSTDGDRYDDGMEFFGVSKKNDVLPSYVTADPLVPATADLLITIHPDVKYLSGETITYGTLNKVVNDHTVTSSVVSKNNLFGAVTTTHTLAFCGGSCGTAGGIRYEGEIKGETGYKYDYTWGTNTEDRLLTSEEVYSINNVVLGDGTIQMWFDIENIGNDILTGPPILTFNFYMGDDEKSFDTKTITTTFENILPKKTIKNISIKDIKLDLKNAKAFLEGKGVRVELEHYSFGDDQNYLTNAAASTLQIIIQSFNKSEKWYLVLPPEGMNVEQVLQAKGLYFTRNLDGAFTKIGTMETQLTDIPYKILSIHYLPQSTLVPEPATVDEMVFHNGDILIIKHNIDTDGDFLTDSYELALGTNPKKFDTDGDGLSDGIENSRCTNPLLADTDWDGIPDGEDENPCEEIVDSDKIVRLFAWIGQDEDGPSASAKIGEYPDYSSIFKEDFSPINSIKVPPGIAVIMYQAPNFEGWTKVFMGDHDNLYEMHDNAGSLKIVDLDEEEPWVILRQSAEWYIKDGEMYSMFVSGKELSPLPIQTTAVTFEEDCSLSNSFSNFPCIMVISGGEVFNWGAWISDVDIPENYLVELYQKENFDGSGNVRVFDNTVQFINFDLHQKVKSLKLYGQGDWKAVLYNWLGEKRGYDETQAQVLNDSIEDLGEDGFYSLNNQVDSLLIAPGWRVILYDGAFFKGACTIHENDGKENLKIPGKKIGMYDKASSVKIEPYSLDAEYKC